MRRTMLIALTFFVISLLGAASAEAVVIDMGASGRYGVALVPGTRSTLTTAGITTVTAGGPCSDPWLAADFILPSTGLCYHGGSVMHANETFAVTWDPHRLDWQTGRDYVEQFLKDVADGSGSLSAQYALTGQYHDSGGRARNASVYGGGCVDFGQPGGSSCKFASAVATGPGHNETSAATARSAVRTTSGRTRAAPGDQTPTSTASPTTRSAPRCRRWSARWASSGAPSRDTRR